MPTSPTQRTLAYCKKNKLTYGKTEHWNSFAHIRQDLFNFIDALIIENNKLIAVQITSQSNVSARFKKIQGIPEAKEWLETGNLIEIWSWKKIKNGKTFRYELNRRTVCYL